MLNSIDIDLHFGEGQEQEQEPFKLAIPDIKNDLNVIIGNNGVGKTMVLVCIWFAGFLLKGYQVALAAAPQEADSIFARTTAEVISMTFDHYKKLSGRIAFGGSSEDPDGDNIDFAFVLMIENGQLSNVNIVLDKPEDYIKIPFKDVIFNSKEGRLFTAYNRYIDILEMTGIDKPRTIGEFKKVAKLHKLYDIMWFERIRAKFESWEEQGYSQHAKSVITDFSVNWPGDDAFGPNPRLVYLNNIPWIKSDTIDKKLSEFGSGHQAVLMTTLFK